MKNLDVSAIVSVWIFVVSSAQGALTISYSGSNDENSSTYELKCNIPVFNDTAAWQRAGSPMTSCITTSCFTTSVPSYNFTVDANAIYVHFNTLTSNEDGIIWTCAHPGETAVTFKVELSHGTTSTTAPITTIPLPTTTPQKCLGLFEAKSCDSTHIVFVLIVTIALSLVTGSCVICWKRNQKKTSLKNKNSSGLGREKKKNTNNALPLEIQN